jgi:hypothetical protein
MEEKQQLTMNILQLIKSDLYRIKGKVDEDGKK